MAGSASVAPAVTQSALLDNDDEPPPQQQRHHSKQSPSAQPSQSNTDLRQAPSQSLCSQSQHESSNSTNSHPSYPVSQQSDDPQSLSISSANGFASSLSSAHSSPPSSSPSPLSPLRQFTVSDVEVHDTIPEESDESDCDSPNEPVTPVSGRQSRDGFQRSDTEPASESASAGVAIPIAIPTNGHQHHQHHSHHGHKHHGQGQDHLHHHRNNSDQTVTPPSGSLGADSTGIFTVEGVFPPAATLQQTAAASVSNNKPTQLTRPIPPQPPAGGLTAPQTSGSSRPDTPTRPNTAVGGSFLIQPPNTSSCTTATNTINGTATESSSSTAVNSVISSSLPTANITDAPSSPTQPRRSRGSSSTTSFKRTMSNLFRRSNTQVDKVMFTTPDYDKSPSNLADLSTSVPNGSVPGHRKTPSRRWSMNRTLAISQSNSPPSPGSPPVEMMYDPYAARRQAGANGSAAASLAGRSASNEKAIASGNGSVRSHTGMPTAEDFFQNDSKKHRQRASTGRSFHSAIHIVSVSTSLGSHRHKNKSKQGGRRVNSFEHGSDNPDPQIKIDPWGLPPGAGTGLKSRRLSLSLEGLNVDVVELHNEFEYQHVLGRHRRHLGSGATSKVTLMFRKGFPGELYAVKEFRGKSSSESPEEYEKKVKSEFSIAKSLHHPNIIETFRLCSDHGRWDHVMEYCQDGDLYCLVEKKYLRRDDREKDRLCLFKQLVMGLNYLHSNGIAHRDIKLENLLITGSCKLKITDFGASDIFSGIHPGLREAGGRCGCKVDGTVRLSRPGICGSLPYISPEVLEAKDPYDPRKLDVWAAAVVMLHLVFGGPLWAEARLKPGQPNDQYAVLLKAWDKLEKKTRTLKEKAEQEEAEKQYAEKLAAASAEDKADVEYKTHAIERKDTATTSTSAATDATAPVSTSVPTDRPVVMAAPLTDGNPNSIVEGPYPSMQAMDIFVNPPVLRRIVLQMLNPDPKRRVTMEQVAKLRWVRNIECCQQDGYDDSWSPTGAPPPPRVIDASKRSATGLGGQKIYCHNHLPPQVSHSIGKV